MKGCPCEVRFASLQLKFLNKNSIFVWISKATFLFDKKKTNF